MPGQKPWFDDRKEAIEPDNPYQHLLEEVPDVEPDPDAIPAGAPPVRERVSRFKKIESHLEERGHWQNLATVRFADRWYNRYVNIGQHVRDLERQAQIELLRHQEEERQAERLRVSLLLAERASEIRTRNRETAIQKRQEQAKRWRRG